MKTYFLLMMLLAGLLACTSSEKAQESPSISFDSLLSQYYEERLKLFPLDATYAGDNRYNDQLPNDLTQEYREKVKSFFTSYRDQLKTIEKNTLSENDQMSYEVLLWECTMALEGLTFNDYLLPINQFWCTPLLIGQIASGSSVQPFTTVKDYDNWLSRLDAYLVWCDTAMANMKKGMATGYVLPKSLTLKVIPQFADLDHGPVEEHLFYTPIKNLPSDFSEAEKERLTDAYRKMVGDKIIPKYRQMHDFIQNEYLPASRETSGVSGVPQGKEMYQFLIKLYTTTEKSADEIFELGKQEVERISKEMEKVKQQVGFKGDLKAFFEYTRTKKELMPFTSAEQVIENFYAIHEKMKPNLQKLFDKVPKTPFEIKRTEAFREQSASAEYNPGSMDGTRPGVFYVPVPDPKEYNILSDEDLFLHEAIPGHHYQISLQQENTELPKFRRTLYYSAYGEGWALYCESLGKELGLYTDPYQYFGMLSAEMHRAIRLVVDVGIHTQGWTREQAIQYSLDHEAESESSVIAEIERYMALPGQALSYKIGQLKIIELRKKAEEALGENFDIAQFHNIVLESGSIPLYVLEGKVNKWILSSGNK